MKRKSVLTIAGSDCSGGAGIQADIKTITAHKLYAMSAITALTAQNTTGVFGVLDTDPDFVAAQLDAIFTDIVPDAVKIGMVSSKEIISVIAGKLKQYQARHIVLDPVMVATSGAKLISDDAAAVLCQRLLPLAEIITPNLPEAECLSGRTIAGREDMAKAAAAIAETYPNHILVKGGHLENNSDDLLYKEGKETWFPGKKIITANTHGTGCTLSSAIACGLAEGKPVDESIAAAKEYLSGALAAGLTMGQGTGPIDHCWSLCTR